VEQAREGGVEKLPLEELLLNLSGEDITGKQAEAEMVKEGD